MKMNYAALAFAVLSTAASAQYAPKRPAKLQQAPARETRTIGSLGSAKVAGDTVWTEDFSNGFAGNNGAWTTAESDGNWWVHSFSGPNGAYSNNGEVITSTSAANGFMVFQADSGNTDFSVNPPAALPAFTDWTGALVSPVIDLSATPFVRLSFEQAQRYCCGSAPQRLEVSTDGGITWPNSFPVVNVGANVDNGTFTTSVNITNAISANPANVKVRFLFNGGDAGTSHYHWQVDDINIIEVFEYDLVMEDAANHSFDLALSFGYDSLPYTVYPYSQLRPVALNMTVLNNGSVDQTGITANYTVTRSGTTVLDQDQVIDLDAGVTEKIFVSPDFVPPAVEGTYDCSYSVTSAVSETTPADNTRASQFDVSEYLYGRDGGVATEFETGDDASGAYELGNLFHITNPTDLTAISVAFRSGAGMAGTLVRGSLRLVDADFSLVENTEEYEIQTGDLNNATGSKFVNLVFQNPVTLDAETPYLVTVEHFGGTNLRTGVNGVSPDQTTFIYFDPPGAQPEDWYFTTSTPMVRMNFDPSVGIDEQAARDILLRARPSVFTESTTVTFKHEGGNASWSLIDVTGRVLRSNNLGNTAAGIQSINIDGADLASGHYMVRVESGATAAAIKLLKAGR